MGDIPGGIKVRSDPFLILFQALTSPCFFFTVFFRVFFFIYIFYVHVYACMHCVCAGDLQIQKNVLGPLKMEL